MISITRPLSKLLYAYTINWVMQDHLGYKGFAFDGRNDGNITLFFEDGTDTTAVTDYLDNKHDIYWCQANSKYTAINTPLDITIQDVALTGQVSLDYAVFGMNATSNAADDTGTVAIAGDTCILSFASPLADTYVICLRDSLDRTGVIEIGVTNA